MIDREKVFDGLKCLADGDACCHSDCHYFDDRVTTSCFQRMAQDALELLKEQQETITSLQGTICKLNAALAKQPEQKHGHWKGFTQSRYFGTDDDGEPIFRDGLFYVCSECRRKSIIRYPYCPRCGAKMDGKVKQDG